ncbi:RNA methyltransferase [Polaromonas sp. YR568]|uniref:TrmH family RNA methyltransferase n=1 Tax=Polaromonas sp. YR568 TaxID=1855301 RepID=UPI0031380281
MTTSSRDAIYVTSRDNPVVKDLRKLSQDSTAYRKQGRVWLEGDHLCRAALARGLQPAIAVYAESGWRDAQPDWVQAAGRNMVLADALMVEISSLESPGRMGFVLDLPAAPALQPLVASVILDRVQDAGNVGSILRSAAAFGFGQVIALKGSAALWSPKVLRAGMGAHFALRLVEGVDLDALSVLGIPLVVTSSHDGQLLNRLLRDKALPMPCAWAMGHEGQGVHVSLMAQAALKVRIDQPGGEESLNVAAAAAICLHASALVASPA